MFYSIALPSLWSIQTRLGISLDVVWLKGAFRVCTCPPRTPHGLTKKKKLLMISILVVLSRVLLEGNVPTHGLAKMVTSCKSFAI